MKKIIVISLIVLCSMSLQAGQKNYLAFSGGKFGNSSNITSNASSSIDSSLNRADHCHSTSWLHGTIRPQDWNYGVYRKISVTATSITTFGTRQKSCNLRLVVPYISAEASATGEIRQGFQYHTIKVGSKIRILNNISGVLVRFKDKQYGTSGMYRPIMAYSEHIAKGGRIGTKVLKVNLQARF